MKPAILLAIAIITVSSLPFCSHHDHAVAQEHASMHSAAAATDQTQASRCVAAQKQQGNNSLLANKPVIEKDEAASRSTCVSADKPNGSIQPRAQNIQERSSLASSQ